MMPPLGSHASQRDHSDRCQIMMLLLRHSRQNRTGQQSYLCAWHNSRERAHAVSLRFGNGAAPREFL